MAARLLGVHRNSVGNKLRELGLTLSDLKRSPSVFELIDRSTSLRDTAHDLNRMLTAERRRSVAKNL